MYKYELIYNHVYPLEEYSNTVMRAVSSEHAEELLAIGNGDNAVVAPASPLACPIGILGWENESDFVEKMGYYVSLWGGAENANI